MRHKASLRVILTLLMIAVGLIFLEGRRIQNRTGFDKVDPKAGNEKKNYNVSNTDFIFFESLSKYLFVTLEN